MPDTRLSGWKDGMLGLTRAQRNFVLRQMWNAAPPLSFHVSSGLWSRGSVGGMAASPPARIFQKRLPRWSRVFIKRGTANPPPREGSRHCCEHTAKRHTPAFWKPLPTSPLGPDSPGKPQLTALTKGKLRCSPGVGVLCLQHQFPGFHLESNRSLRLLVR